MARSAVLIALFSAALVHLTLDFPLHNDDARAHFWPLTNWKFTSPVSYWDPLTMVISLGQSKSALLWKQVFTHGVNLVDV